uniref:Uncharacterized protein n=1 Tax=Anguilla anguilla TaxID=7936 RepID=A0A0E9SHJ6_ANGAN
MTEQINKSIYRVFSIRTQKHCINYFSATQTRLYHPTNQHQLKEEHSLLYSLRGLEETKIVRCMCPFVQPQLRAYLVTG